jgi:hypothetical protein
LPELRPLRIETFLFSRIRETSIDIKAGNWNLANLPADNCGVLCCLGNNLDLFSLLIIIIIALMMEAISSSETLVNIHQTTRCNIPENSHI